jgi:O-antigen ligase
VIYFENRVEKFLNLLLIFLLPTQLAFHFWPNFAFVFGIRVDYLAPTVYLTDLLFMFLFVIWITKAWKRVLIRSITKNKVFIIGFLLVAVLNISFSSFYIISFLKWLKLFEVVVLAYYISVRKDIFDKKNISTSLFLSLVFFSLIGIFQVIKGGTIGGIMYYLGERSFNIVTPGIALGKIGGTLFIRAYSTFPHPNALAGYLIVGTLILFSNFTINKFSALKILGLIIIILALILSFSLSSLIGIIICVFTYLIYKKGILKKETLPVMVIIFFVVSLIFAVFSKQIIETNINFPQSISQRLELALVAGKILSKNFIFGTGLNTFIPNEVKVYGINSYLWLLQPVHNIYLLIISEMGIIGGIFLYLLILKIMRKTLDTKYVGYFLAIIFIMVSGLFDHYWFTLQQNLLLLGLLIGESLQAKG